MGQAAHRLSQPSQRRNASPRDSAAKTSSIRAAKALDLADELGSIEPGKAADVVIWESEPFKAGGRPRTVLINGKIQYQTEN